MKHQDLVKIISSALTESEESSDVVITTNIIDDVSKVIADKILESGALSVLTSEEVLGINTLIYHAINEAKFFDWEMPTKCGYTAEQFDEISKKLRESVGI